MDLNMVRPDWVKDKESSKFVFPGICWERSHVPKDVWKAGDADSNLIETVHRDSNREGVQCTLVGGLKKSQLFDTVKVTTLQASLVVPMICPIF